MPRLADTVAVEQAQAAWLGHDRPGLISQAGVRTALLQLPGDFTLEDVAEWARPAFATIADASNMLELESRLVGVITSALLVGAMLERTNGT